MPVTARAMFKLALLFSAALISTPAFAQSEQEHGDHDDGASEIVVTALYGRNRADVLAGTSVVQGEELLREVRPTIGETLSRQAGVSATSFGPNASRPVLRGFQGERVRVLQDGIGSFDVSNTSVDHAVAINPLTADRIEVLRGPSALLFGSSAIGGVVNVVDSRIPRHIPEEGVHIDATATYGSAADERSGAARVDLALSDRIVVHLDGTYAKTDDLEIGGFTLSKPLRAIAAASPDADIRGLAALRGRLPNSAGRVREVAAGAAVITGTGNMGFSVSRYENLYGVPVRYSLDPAIEAEQVRIDAGQTRVDLRAEVNPESGFLDAIRFRGGYADYAHSELEDDGAVGTRFLNDGWEGRLELVQRERGGWRGAIGGQVLLRNLNIVGDEKFLPESETQQFGVFTVQSFDFGGVRAEVGGRVEHSILRANADADLGNPFIRRRFTAYSGSAGASVDVFTGWKLGLNASYTERAPSAEELFANGPHAGTQAFEVGNPGFVKERSKGLEATLKGSGDGWSVDASLYHSWFDNFIIDQPTGAIVDDLPVFQYTQSDARYYGAEIEATARLAQLGDFKLNLDGVADFTRAKLSGGGNVPRIPPLRLLGGVEAQSETITGRLEAEWVDRQAKIAAFETATKGYTMVNASLSVKPLGADGPLSVLLAANNLFDVNARRHASFLKDYAPLAGRDIRLTARVSF